MPLTPLLRTPIGPGRTPVGGPGSPIGNVGGNGDGDEETPVWQVLLRCCCLACLATVQLAYQRPLSVPAHLPVVGLRASSSPNPPHALAGLCGSMCW